MLGGAVGAPHVAGAGCLGSICGDLMFLSGVSTYELTLLGEQMWGVSERADTIETVSGSRHGRGGDSNSLLGAVGARLGSWRRQRLHGQGSRDVGRAVVDRILVQGWLSVLVRWTSWGWHRR
jgi:hypothetical protein